MSYTKKHIFDETVVDKIYKYIKRNDYTIKAVAEKSGLTYNQLYQVLKKNQLIKLSDYVKICEALNVPLEEFIDK